ISREEETLKENILSDDEFDICRELDIILKLFYELTEMLEGSKYPALSIVTPAIENLRLYGSFFDLRFKILLYTNKMFDEENYGQTEFDKYLKLIQLPVIEENNLLRWWSQNKYLFPTLAKLARKYLLILAFSAPNGGLFLNIKNHILDLDIDIVNCLIFLKHNL
ncbi:17021_t:CDS:2, partial [Racocetra persica]